MSRFLTLILAAIAVVTGLASGCVATLVLTATEYEKYATAGQANELFIGYFCAMIFIALALGLLAAAGWLVYNATKGRFL